MRRKTINVSVGDVIIGSDYPIVTQSMTTASTLDTEASVEEAIRIIDAGGQIVRFTAPNIKEAENLQNIKDSLRNKGYTNPLVADIHFTPNAAMTAAEIVEKVRINPGNYVDRKKFEIKEYDDKTYNDELLKIEDRFIPLLDICKKHNTAIRIGTNHGSLSDRIMNRFGDTPLGMVESALEFLRICNKNNFDQVILSMKSSNPLVMVHAYRLLVKKMDEENMHFPLHLGVTEAGDGLDGRIKSSLGIGSLLNDGIGDTIRVSLTEDPEFEIPTAKKIIDKIKILDPIKKNDSRLSEYHKRFTSPVLNIGGDNVPVVLSNSNTLFEGNGPDYFYDEKELINNKNERFPYFHSIKEYRQSDNKSDIINFVSLNKNTITNSIVSSMSKNVVFIFDFDDNPTDFRDIFNFFEKQDILNPVLFKKSYQEKDFERLSIDVSIDFGTLLLEGMGNGLWLDSKHHHDRINELSFSILQNTRTRIFKTDYISCPSCGRTKFDLQETTALVKEKTSHLKDLKIAVMGCIVNGPGEMADADYGYVGSGKDIISLYKGKDLVKRNISSKDAVDELINLIKANDDWIDPSI
ncbi:MAG: (E)-4-hydroxy-3-methylbut-2-enyl-diphosphate synthase [Candidatus Neomarinimicrobiota bacterium]|nr:(E)-4-hydroxy-3-methylbut-2-enyl-diphosphate synthase [Candidatus Neomarinimicrobiota bacterium]